MTKKRKRSDDDNEKLNNLISLLAHKPWATRADQLSALGGGGSDKLKYWWRQLEKKEYAVINPVLIPENVRVGFQRFWIFIETRFDENHRDEVITMSGPDGERRSEGFYQQWVCDKLKEVVTTHYSDTMRCGGAEVLLGGGGWDIIFILDAQDERLAHLFVLHHVRTCPHVTRSSTAWSVSQAGQ